MNIIKTYIAIGKIVEKESFKIEKKENNFSFLKSIKQYIPFRKVED